MIDQNLSQRLKHHFHLFNHRRYAILHPIFITIGITLILVIAYELYKYVDIWNTWSIAGGNSFHFCELNKEGMAIKQISNTWSNLGYLMVGLILFSIGFKDHHYKHRSDVSNPMAKHPGFTILLGIAMVYLFIGSFFYHASLSLAFQKMDITGIYAILLALFTYNLFKAFPTIKIKGKIKSSHKLFLTVGVLLNLLFIIEIWKWNINAVFPVMVILLLILNIYSVQKSKVKKVHVKYITLSVVTMIVASTLWVLDRTNIVCSPTSIFQGHALWHILTSLAVLFIYFYYRTEEFPNKNLATSKAC